MIRTSISEGTWKTKTKATKLSRGVGSLIEMDKRLSKK